MGIRKRDLGLILDNLKKISINKENALIFAVNGIEFQHDYIQKVAKKKGFKLADIKKIKYDNVTQFGNTLHQETLFKLLGFKNVESIDYSDYEGANIIHNLNNLIPKNLYNKYTYIGDFGTTEHVFNTFQVLKNIALLLKEGGIAVHLLPVIRFVNHGYYSFSPRTFFDFYSTNGFEILTSKLLIEKSKLLTRKSRFYYINYNHYTDNNLLNSITDTTQILFVAKKTKSVKNIVAPSEDNFYNINGYTPDTYKTDLLSKLQRKLKQIQFNSYKKRIYI